MSDRRRNLFILAFVAGLLAASLAIIASQPTKLGLDLKGGVSLIYQAKPTKETKVNGDSISRAIDIMRKRVDKLGVAEPEIQRTGSDEIDVSLPGSKNADEARRQVGKTAQLYFYDWETNVLDDQCKPDPTNQSVTGGPSAGTVGALSYYDAVVRASKCPQTSTGKETTTGQFYLINDKKQEVLAGPQEVKSDLLKDIADRKIPTAGTRIVEVKPGTVVLQAEPSANGTASDQYYVLRDQPALGGSQIRNPKQSFDNGPGGTGAPIVTFDFTDKGKTIWQKVTRQIAQRGQNNYFGGSPQSAFQHFAIALDNQIISTPYIDFNQNPDGIDATNGSEISGGFTIKSAQNLANLLQTGALPLKLNLISSSSVSATLGKQALSQGLFAGMVGLILVSLFLLLVYRVLGLVAIGALVVYGIFMFALVKLIPITLTLPGIAGLILTIGVAADANIVIFERVKEEMRHGRSVPLAISQGYKKGLSAIVDANVVTFMVAFILFILATAGVKGFAFTLGVGTIVSFLTAVMLTQAVLGTLGQSGLISHPAALGAQSKTERFRWDYMGHARWFFSLSGAILLVGALAVGANGLNLGIDFTSGTRLTAEFAQKASEAQIRDALGPVGLAKAEIQRISGKDFKNGQAFQISTETLSPSRQAKVESTLDKRFGNGSFSFETIGPTFGKTVANSAIIAIIASLIVISSYIALRFEWRYAVPVLIALMHDLLITAGVYALLKLEVTTATVAALLTILGYSLYDTIIVFDRVRENVPRMPRAAFSQILNRSMSEVLMRSLATSFSTLLPIVALILFGGETLKDFAIALAVGVLSGTYSSIFIASPVLMHWKEGEPVWRQRRARVAAANGGVVPAYATAAGGASIEVEPQAPKRPSRRVTAPDEPGQTVSQAEFDEMVRDLHADETATATAEPEEDLARDLLPEDLVLKDDPKKTSRPRRPRNRRHGRR
ncbi:MAG TPA: protein translocase subunit SecD [Solirubrobacteraceae bacterium]|nr:protein translocase subunit SecD [Solirubrobacteraceae bacterium]